MKECSAWPQRIFSILGILSFALAFAAFTSTATVAQDAAPTDQKAAEQPSNDTGLETLPLSPIEKAERDGTAVRLSEKDIIKLALENNIDVAIEDLKEETALQNIKSQNGAYDPDLKFTLRQNSSKSSSTNVEQLGDQVQVNAFLITSKDLSWNAQFTQPVRTGGNFSASWNTSRSVSDAGNSLYDTSYRSTGQFTFTQPLLKNLRIDSNRSQLKIVKLNLETTNSQFRRTLTTNISRIQQQYWDLISAIGNYDIQRNSLKLAQKNLSDIRKKVEVGTLAQIEITQANYQVAQTRLSLINAENTIERQMNSLRQYISNDRNNDIWSKVIVPTDTPDFREYKIEMATAIDTALKNRPELEQSDLELKKSDINLALARNNLKWGLDLQVNYNSQGNSGTPGPSAYRYNPATDTTTLLIPDTNLGGLGTAYKNLFTQGVTGWSIQVTVDVPLRDRAAKAALANQLISRKNTNLQRNKTEQQIQIEIRNAIQALETNRQQVETAKINKDLAREQLDGENKRFEAGLSEFYRVLDQQNRYAEAENRELTALIQYRQSIITLEEAMNTLLELNDIKVAKSASEHIPDLR